MHVRVRACACVCVSLPLCVGLCLCQNVWLLTSRCVISPQPLIRSSMVGNPDGFTAHLHLLRPPVAPGQRWWGLPCRRHNNCPPPPPQAIPIQLPPSSNLSHCSAGFTDRPYYAAKTVVYFMYCLLKRLYFNYYALCMP